MKTGIIGTGNLGASIARGILNENLSTSLVLTKKSMNGLEEFQGIQGVTCTTNNKVVAEQSEVIILAVQPAQLSEVLDSIKNDLKENQLIISTVTGYAIERIEKHLGSQQPIVRAMPNTAIAVGQSMTTICGNKPATSKMTQAMNIFNCLGSSMIIEEDKMQAATVVCASGIAFWMRLIRANTQGAVQLGFDAKEAQEMAVQTAFGAASLLLNSGNHPESEIDKVTTPKGCTIEGLNEMEFRGLSAAMIKGMRSSYDKINDIAANQ